MDHSLVCLNLSPKHGHGIHTVMSAMGRLPVIQGMHCVHIRSLVHPQSYRWRILFICMNMNTYHQGRGGHRLVGTKHKTP